MDRNSRCWLRHDKYMVPKSAAEEKIARDEERFRGLRASCPSANLTWICREFARLIANNDESTSDTRETTMRVTRLREITKLISVTSRTAWKCHSRISVNNREWQWRGFCKSRRVSATKADCGTLLRRTNVTNYRPHLIALRLCGELIREDNQAGHERLRVYQPCKSCGLQDYSRASYKGRLRCLICSRYLYYWSLL